MCVYLFFRCIRTGRSLVDLPIFIEGQRTRVAVTPLAEATFPPTRTFRSLAPAAGGRAVNRKIVLAGAITFVATICVLGAMDHTQLL
ncbi:hypothetical protein GPALN_010138 [Globodera pallida]|nr:hypothetical protein GPALN_010138 [Globodera pallida]